MTQHIIDRLKFFSEAWDARCAEAVASCFTTNGTYAASVGPEPGERAVGRQGIQILLKKMFAHDKGVTSEVLQTIIMPTTAFWTWRYHRADGGVELGCDFFEFEDGLIKLKDAYRKQWLPESH